jgi:uncharacterized membrane protein
MDKFEDYLENMASNGWILTSSSFSHMILHFEQSTNRKVRFCLDYQTKYSSEYLQILKDDGWENLGVSGGWGLFMKEYTLQRPDVFTDNNSLIERSRRVLRLLFLPIFLFMVNLSTIISAISRNSALGYILLFLYFIISVLSLFGIYKLNKNIKKLKVRI